MAIIIPSRNIYEINNPKVRDNVITKVGVERTIITPKNEYDVSVYNGTVFTEGESYSIGVKETDSEFVSSNANPGSYTESVEYVEATPYTINGTVVVPKVANNTFISHLKNGVDYDGNSDIKARVVYRTDTAPTTASATVRTLAANTYLVSVSNISIGAYTIGTSSKENADEFLSISTTNTKVEFDTPIQISTVYENEEDYTFDYSLVIGSEQIKLTYGATYVQGTTIPDVKPLNGTAYKNVPLSVEITCYGDTVSIDLTNNTIEYGDGNKPFTLSGSEIMQDSSKYSANNTSTTEHLATNILNDYKSGKETAVLKCDIGEYYDDGGILAISTKTSTLPMTFNLGDIVIPYVFGVGGQDKPMSRYKDGSPKQFRIVGTRVFFSGATWQELTLQEL